MANRNSRWYARRWWRAVALCCAGVLFADAVFNEAWTGRFPWHGIVSLSLVGAIIAVRQKRGEQAALSPPD